MFSPPSIIRDTLHESLTFDQATPSRRVGHLLKAIEPSISQVSWEAVSSQGFRCISLKFWRIFLWSEI